MTEKQIPHPSALRAYGLRMTVREAVASDHDMGYGYGRTEKNPPLRTKGGAPRKT